MPSYWVLGRQHVNLGGTHPVHFALSTAGKLVPVLC